MASTCARGSKRKRGVPPLGDYPVRALFRSEIVRKVDQAQEALGRSDLVDDRAVPISVELACDGDGTLALARHVAHKRAHVAHARSRKRFEAREAYNR